MKLTKFARNLAASILSVVLTTSANAAIISSSSWQVTGISGSWDAATSGWWLHESTPTAAEADGFMSDGYTHYASSYSSPQNGYSTWSNTATSVMEVTFDSLYDFNRMEIWLTRNNGLSTTVSVLGRTGTSAWSSILSTTTGALGLPNCSASCALSIGSLDLSSAPIYDQLRIEFGTQNQVILHELVFDGKSAAVPTPGSIPLVLAGLVGLGVARRRKAA